MRLRESPDSQMLSEKDVHFMAKYQTLSFRLETVSLKMILLIGPILFSLYTSNIAWLVKCILTYNETVSPEFQEMLSEASRHGKQ